MNLSIPSITPDRLLTGSAAGILPGSSRKRGLAKAALYWQDLDEFNRREFAPAPYIRVVTLELPNTVSSTTLTDGKGRIRGVLNHRFPLGKRETVIGRGLEVRAVVAWPA